MTAQLAPLAVQKFFDNNGFPLAFGQLTTYAAGTTTPQASYVDSTQSTPNTNPIQLNFRGECNLWLDPTKSYKFLLQDLFGNTIPGWPIDNIPGGFGALPISVSLIPSPTNTQTLGNTLFSWANVYVGPNIAPVLDSVSGNIGYYARTAAEVTAGIIPTNYAYSVYNVKRYGAKGDGTTDDTVAIQTALNLAGANNYSSIYFPTGNYKVTSTLTITGFNVTLYGEGVWASQITSAVIGNPANPLFQWVANVGGTNGQFLQVQGLRFNGNGLTGSNGNGHAFALIGLAGVTFDNFPTFRDCDFVSFSGTGKSQGGTSIPAAGLYCYFGDVLKIENCTFEACNQGVVIDGTAANSTQKVAISASTFDNCVVFGLQVLFCDNLLVDRQTIFNNMQVGIYLNNVTGTATIRNCRFKLITAGNAIQANQAVNIDQINICENYFYTSLQSTVFPVISVGTNCQGAVIQGNNLFFDSTVLLGIGIQLTDVSGIVGGVVTINGNRFQMAGAATLASCIEATNASVAINSLTITGNYFGQASTPGAAQNILVGLQLTGAGGLTSPTITGNTFSLLAPGSITTAIQLGSAVNRASVINNTYLGAVTTPLSNAGVNTFVNERGIFSPGDAATQAAIATNGTITSTNQPLVRVSPAANVTGVILQAGLFRGQYCVVENNSAFTITFAAAGTSNVADGATSAIPANCSRFFVWDANAALWYRAA